MPMLRNFNSALLALFVFFFSLFFIAASTCALAISYSEMFKGACITFIEGHLPLIKFIASIQIALFLVYFTLLYIQKKGLYIQLSSRENVCVNKNIINASITQFLDKEKSKVPFSLKIDKKNHIHLHFHQTLPQPHFVDNFSTLEKALKRHLFLQFGYTKPFYFMVKV